MRFQGPGCRIAGGVGVVLLFLGGTALCRAGEPVPEPGTDGYYVSIGSSSVAAFSLKTTSPALSPATIRTRTGYDLGAGLGYRSGNIRVEGRILYGRFDADRISFAEGGGALSGYFDLLGATVDVLHELPMGTRLRPYVGAGLGAVRFRARSVTLAGFPPTVGENNLLSYQLMGGLAYTGPSWRVTVGYRYMGIGAQDYETGGVPLRGKSLGTNAVQLGAQFAF